MDNDTKQLYTALGGLGTIIVVFIVGMVALSKSQDAPPQTAQVAPAPVVQPTIQAAPGVVEAPAAPQKYIYVDERGQRYEGREPRKTTRRTTTKVAPKPSTNKRRPTRRMSSKKNSLTLSQMTVERWINIIENASTTRELRRIDFELAVRINNNDKQIPRLATGGISRADINEVMHLNGALGYLRTAVQAAAEPYEFAPQLSGQVYEMNIAAARGVVKPDRRTPEEKRAATNEVINSLLSKQAENGYKLDPRVR